MLLTKAGDHGQDEQLGRAENERLSIRLVHRERTHACRDGQLRSDEAKDLSQKALAHRGLARGHSGPHGKIGRRHGEAGAILRVALERHLFL